MPIHDWSLAEHRSVPERRPVPAGLTASGCEPICFAGPDYRGRPTRVFAWLGLPAGASPDRPVPAVVLVHGGLGTAMAEWVRLWTARGYAAISIDHGGCLPIDTGDHEFQRLPDGGPANCGGFDQVDEQPTDRWNHHAVANVIRAHSLLRELPEVAADRTALVGISWGGCLSCTVAALDERFRCAVSVYGCGRLIDSPLIGPRIRGCGPRAAAEWSARWDPEVYLPRIGVPVCFINGVHDRHFPPSIWSPSTRLPGAAVTRSLQIDLGHSHAAGWAPPEIAAFVAQHCADGPPLPRLGLIEATGNRFSVPVACAQTPPRVVCWTTDEDDAWPGRSWRPRAAEQHDDHLRVDRRAGDRAAFFQLHTDDELVVSSDVWIDAH